MPTDHAMINLLSDGHVHTSLCNHACGTMEQYVEAGIKCGLDEIIFLEHLEAGIRSTERTWLNEQDFNWYFAEGKRLQGKYGDRISIGLGVEVGYNPEHREELLEKIAARPWDKIGLSCHFLKLPGTNRHLNLLSRKQQNIDAGVKSGVENLLTRYFDTLNEGVHALPATVLCHLDAALRFVPGLAYTDAHYRSIRTLLQSMKTRGMALELNTSGIPIRGEPFPSSTILAMALELDIPLTAGSDAHNPSDVGRFFNQLPQHITSAACP